jgi:hypothetical protein
MTQTDTPLSDAEMRGPLESFACLSSFTPSQASCQRRSDFASSSRRENASRLNKECTALRLRHGVTMPIGAVRS